jgi:hypothetical protein
MRNHRYPVYFSVPLLLCQEGREIRGNQPPLVEASSTTPEYFHLLGIPLLRGRLFSNQDNENAPLVAVINQAYARAYWPDGDPLGKRLKVGRRGASWTTVVGVIEDAHTESLEENSVPKIYKGLFQQPDKDQNSHKELVIFLRGRLDPARIPEEARVAVQSINPELPVFGAVTLSDAASGSLSQWLPKANMQGSPISLRVTPTS